MKKLQPLIFKDDYYSEIEREIKNIFMRSIYSALVKELKTTVKILTNAAGDSLFEAVAKGLVNYDGEKFTGKFNSRISRSLRKIGAKFKRGAWYLPNTFLPAEIAIAAAQADARYKAIYQGLLKTIDSIDIDKAIADSPINASYFRTVTAMNDAFLKTVKGVSIAPEMTMQARQIIAGEWGNNLKLYIKDWSRQNIIKLRKEVQASAFAGHRAEALIKTIQNNYAVSNRKAKFLARQETSLLMSKMREQRYKDIGAAKYIWRGSMDERERADHKALEGKVIYWDSPPIVDRATGRRAHAGEDFGCRCVAEAVLE